MSDQWQSSHVVQTFLFSDAASQFRLTSPSRRGWTFWCKCFHLKRISSLNPKCFIGNTRIFGARWRKAGLSLKLHGAFWWAVTDGGFGGWSCSRVCPSSLDVVASRSAALEGSSITPTKNNISLMYPKHGNLWSLRALSLDRPSESESGNGDSCLTVWAARGHYPQAQRFPWGWVTPQCLDRRCCACLAGCHQIPAISRQSL